PSAAISASASSPAYSGLRMSCTTTSNWSRHANRRYTPGARTRSKRRLRYTRPRSASPITTRRVQNIMVFLLVNGSGDPARWNAGNRLPPWAGYGVHPAEEGGTPLTDAERATGAGGGVFRGRSVAPVTARLRFPTLSAAARTRRRLGTRCKVRCAPRSTATPGEPRTGRSRVGLAPGELACGQRSLERDSNPRHVD